MKAVVYDAYGPPDVLQLREVPDPELGETDVLVRVEPDLLEADDPRDDVHFAMTRRRQRVVQRRRSSGRWLVAQRVSRIRFGARSQHRQRR